MAALRRGQVLLGCLLALSLAAAAAPGDAAPPPRPLCDACGDSFEATAATHGLDLTVEGSTATVIVHESGSATWVVRNRLAGTDDADRLRTNATLRAEVGDRAMWDTEFLGATVSEEGVVTLRYRDPGFAEPSVGGTLRSGEFTAAYGYRNLDGLGADRLTVVAPDGMRVGWAAPGATVSDGGARMTLTDLEREGFVTFVPRDGHPGPLWSLLAVGALVGPTFVVNVSLQVALPAAVFGLLVAALGSALSWRGSAWRWTFERIRDRPGIAIVAERLALSRSSVSYRRLVAAAAFGVAVTAGSTLAAAAAFGQNGITPSYLTAVPFLVPLFALLPAGYAVGRGRRRLAAGTAAGGFVLGVLPLASPFTPSALGLLFVPLIAALYAAAIAVVGSPLFVVGASLGGARSRGDLETGSPS